MERSLGDRVIALAKEVIDICRQLDYMKKTVIARQLLRSATSIGAAYAEAKYAESAEDFIHKMKVAAKEASETAYWFSITDETTPIRPEVKDELLVIQKMISKSIGTSIANKKLRDSAKK